MEKLDNVVNGFLFAIEKIKGDHGLAKTIPALCLCGFRKDARGIAKRYAEAVNTSSLFECGYKKGFVEVEIERTISTKEECNRIFQQIYNSQWTNRYYGTVFFNLYSWNGKPGGNEELLGNMLVSFLRENRESMRAVLWLPDKYQGDFLIKLSGTVGTKIIKDASTEMSYEEKLMKDLSSVLPLGSEELQKMRTGVRRCLQIAEENELPIDFFDIMADQIIFDMASQSQNESLSEAVEKYCDRFEQNLGRKIQKRKIGF